MVMTHQLLYTHRFSYICSSGNETVLLEWFRLSEESLKKESPVESVVLTLISPFPGPLTGVNVICRVTSSDITYLLTLLGASQITPGSSSPSPSGGALTSSSWFGHQFSLCCLKERSVFLLELA
eukprot:Blabericola_migrator_1__8506@NODE_4440_length_1158_cov_4_183318_g2748_i0_p2_GENE_NODE_4440_length_1158_cov_4_183318_g2748_i0NODE_4440_length_1158_cov_4_183318_g2748_i0_p2_ORF_typecomplete_len124_score11_92_NODE_4440_length_1158_cov_4_183318_g2748_i07411112